MLLLPTTCHHLPHPPPHLTLAAPLPSTTMPRASHTTFTATLLVVPRGLCLRTICHTCLGRRLTFVTWHYRNPTTARTRRAFGLAFIARRPLHNTTPAGALPPRSLHPPPCATARAHDLPTAPCRTFFRCCVRRWFFVFLRVLPCPVLRAVWLVYTAYHLLQTAVCAWTLDNTMWRYHLCLPPRFMVGTHTAQLLYRRAAAGRWHPT